MTLLTECCRFESGSVTKVFFFFVVVVFLSAKIKFYNLMPKVLQS